MMKASFREGPRTIRWNLGTLDAKGGLRPQDNGILCSDHLPREQLKNLMSELRGPSLVHGNMSRDDLETLGVRIEQEIYFFDETSSEIWESYSVNGVLTVRKVMRVANGTSVERIDERGFLERRGSNLHGINFRVMCDNQRPYVVDMTPDARLGIENVTSPSGDDLKRLDGEAFGGLFMEVHDIMKREMNFTADLFMRRDRRWGVFRNGSWDGMISSLVKGEADYILASVTLTAERSAAVDYLLPLGNWAQRRNRFSSFALLLSGWCFIPFQRSTPLPRTFHGSSNLIIILRYAF